MWQHAAASQHEDGQYSSTAQEPVRRKYLILTETTIAAHSIGWKCGFLHTFWTFILLCSAKISSEMFHFFQCTLFNNTLNSISILALYCETENQEKSISSMSSNPFFHFLLFGFSISEKSLWCVSINFHMHTALSWRSQVSYLYTFINKWLHYA